jgi:SnoaL-like domain
MTSVEERLQRIEDRQELADLAVRYFNACDERDFDTIAEAFATDAEMGEGYGRDQIVELIREDRSLMGTTIHSPDSMLFTFADADHASGVIGSHCELARDGRTLYGAMRYIDTYVRERGTWRIQTREVKMIHVGGWEEVADSLSGETPVRWPGEIPAVGAPLV